MQGIERDPAGLLERVPELGQIAAEHPAIARAIEKGKPHALYWRLFWLRVLGKAGLHESVVRELVARRRLFALPMRRTPVLFTLNGVGARLYGSADLDPKDGTSLGTHYLVLLFIPIYPLASYWVRAASGRSWQFFARVPLSPMHYLWQRGLALLLLLVVAVGGWQSVYASRHQVVHVANGLPIPVKIKIGSESLSVPEHGLGTLQVKLGNYPIEVRAQDKDRLIERGALDASRHVGALVWNVLGLGFVYEQTAEYRANDSSHDSGPEPTVHCDEQRVQLDDVDYAFVEPPKSLDLSSSTEVLRKSCLAFESKASCVSYLMSHGKRELAIKALARYSEATGFPETETKLVLETLAGATDLKAARAFAELAVAARPESIEIQRGYQNLLLFGGETRAQIAARYKPAFEAHPERADSAYLYGRFLTGEEETRFLTQVAPRFPDDPYLLRMQSYFQERTGANQAAADSFESLLRISPKLADESLEIEIPLLARLGRVARARSLIRDALKQDSGTENTQADLARWGILLASRDPRENAEEFLNLIHAGNDDLTLSSKLRARVEGLLPTSEKDLDALSFAPLRDALQLELALRADPKPALVLLNQATKEAREQLSFEAWALFAGEALRSASPATFEQLMNAQRAGSEHFGDYLKSGRDDDFVADVTPRWRSALHFARARALSDNPRERDRLLALARSEDSLHGLVTLALDTWK